MADLARSTALSRRGFLASVALLAAPGLLRSQEASAPTTDSQALEGMAVEPKPDYTLVAKFATYDVDLLYGVDADGNPEPGSDRLKVGKFQFMTRSWAMDGVLDDNYLGPLIEIRPGDKFTVLVRNELFEEGDYADYGPEPPRPEDWMTVINQKVGPSVFLHEDQPLGYPFFNTCTPDTPIGDFVIDEENVPKNFNWTNLHLHGLEIDPHLFEPQGTSNPAADYITIKPGGDYLYRFELPEDHPQGTFWYHPHRHNSVAIQAWGGLAGLLIIRGLYDDELKDYGVTTEIPFVVHDPHYEIVEYPDGDEPGIAKVGRFLQNQNGLTDYTYMVSGRFQPTYTVKRNEIVQFRHLTATVENLACFRIVAAPGTLSQAASEGVEGENHPFYMTASDGIAFGGAPVKKNMMVTGGGERHDLLMCFEEPGEYLIKSDHLGTIQFFGTGPRDQILAKIVVTEEDAGQSMADIEAMRFTPGIPAEGPPGVADIQPSEITRRRHFVFDMDGDTCRLPNPQFRINDTVYATDKVDFEIEQGTVEEWVLVNPTGGTHPFHVHVNAFQVKESYSAQVPDPKLVGADAPVVQSRIDALKTIDHPNQWRDTMIIPPKGYLRVWTRMYSKRVGKTVLHCHFLAHEETAMIQNFLIRPAGG
ncbi:multicopper oxidase family protein [Microbaculum marinum]|uniref:Multicopper oxidase domain-containing protein n=1 Tax=Microbaculum marinum TaxID=1764581 RepID=A0AAW9S2D5_9HYPH